MIQRLWSLRFLAGPLLAGTGIWCALGEVSLVHPDLPSVRLAAPAPTFWWLVAVLFALLVPAWRRSVLTASPAILATLPWWPIPVPALALLWTGRLAWVPIGLAFGAAFIRARPSRESDVVVGVRSARGQAAIAGVLTLTGVLLVALSLAPRLPGGDEPHYLVITQSLLRDGDLQIQNNHDQREYAAYVGGTLAPDFIQRGRNGEIYSIHAPGTSLLVLPGFAMFGYRGAQATIMLLAAIAGALVWLIGWRATCDRRAAWFCWAAVTSAIPFLIQSVTIFPDGPGLVIVAASILLLLHLDRAAARVPASAILIVSILLAALPWLHSRFVVFAAGLGLLVTWRLVRGAADGRWRRVATFLAVPVVSAGAWFAYFQIIYGTFNPSAPYGTSPGIRLAYVPGGVAGLIFDEQFGLLTYAPVLAAAAFAGLGRKARPDRPMWPVALVAFAYLAVAGTYFMWWAGVPATPARFAAAALPVLAAPLAVAYSRSGVLLRSIWLMLLGLSLSSSVALLGVDHGLLAWNVRGVRSEWLDWLGGVVDLSRGWPSFFWQVVPGVVASETRFALHLAAWLAVLVIAGLLAAMVRRRVDAGRHAATLAAWWIALTMTMLVGVGWRSNGVSGMRAMRSQVDVLRADAEQQSIVRIAPWTWRYQANASALMTIRVDRTDWFDGTGTAWASMSDVPAGKYEATVFEERPRGGAVSVRVGAAAEPIQVVTLDARSIQKFEVALPAGAASLSFEPDPVLASAGRAIELRPVSVAVVDPAAARVRRSAVSAATYGGLSVFFLDTNVFSEPDGFWIKGGESAAFAIEVPAGRSPFSMQLSNGGAPNNVRVDVDGRTQTMALVAGEGRSIPVSSAGVVRIVVASSSGFRPSEAGTSSDGRYLGVRVRVGDGRQP